MEVSPKPVRPALTLSCTVIPPQLGVMYGGAEVEMSPQMAERLGLVKPG